MIVSIGMHVQDGPWGGGNQFGAALTAFLRAHGETVVFDLDRPDIDIILLTEPRRELRSCAFDDRDIRTYRANVNPNALVVHRVNECDERKGTVGVNARLREANTVADATVFISSWLMDLHVGQGMTAPGRRVILNGADTAVFHPQGGQRWYGEGPLRLVTHHWGANRRKGFDTYEQLDTMLGTPKLRGALTFTYVGNLPPDVRFRNTQVVTPLHGVALADMLRRHHVYITGSENEPAGMHHIEGAACGLPLVYKRSGALPEYCSAFGIGFDGADFPEAVREMVATYHVWADRVGTYPYSADRMSEEYHSLFLALLEGRNGPAAPVTTCGAKTGTSVPATHRPSHSGWMDDAIPGISTFLSTLRSGSHPIRYRVALDGVLPAGEALGLGYAALATKLHVILGSWQTMAPEEQVMHMDVLRSYQREDTGPEDFWGPGAFVDQPLVQCLHQQGHSSNECAQNIRRAILAESKQAIATLAEIGASPQFRYHDLPATSSGVREYFQCLDWRQPWSAGGQASALVTLLATGHGSAPSQMQPELLHAARQCYRTLLDPASGAYFSGPRPEHSTMINGAMKVLTALDWIREPIHAPAQLIDTCLSRQPLHEGCHLVDVAYVLYRCAGQTHHRRRDVVNYSKALLDMIRLHHNPDGGFSYFVGKSQTVYYGVPVTSGKPVSDIHGTLLLTWALAMVTQLIDEDRCMHLSVIRP